MALRLQKAVKRLSFSLTEGLTAILYDQIAVEGNTQYHFILAVFGAEKKPVVTYVSEWRRDIPESADKPTLGLYENGTHRFLGDSVHWAEVHLFLLHVGELVRARVSITDPSLNQGELWANQGLEQVFAKQKLRTDSQSSEQEFWETMTGFDDSMIGYPEELNTLTPSQQRRK